MVLVAGALLSGSAVLVGVAAVLAVVLGIAATACLVEDSLGLRRAAAAADAALAARYTDLFATQAAEHQRELEHLVAKVAALVSRVGELGSRNAELAARNADLESAAVLAGLAAAARARAEQRAEQEAVSTVVPLPVVQFDRSSIVHARASGE